MRAGRVPAPMALRATNGPALDRKSARVGEIVTVSAKVENTAQVEESVTLAVEDVREGALARPVDYAFSFDPPSIAIPPKSRRAVSFSWRAGVPADKPAFTFRGRLVLRRSTDGALVGAAPLDFYVGS